MAHVGINAMFLEPNMGGLATYVREVVPAIAAEAPSLRVTVFVNEAGKDYLSARGMPDSVELVTDPMVGRRGTRAIGEVALMGRMARRHGADLLYSAGQIGPLRSPVPHVVMIADVIWLTNHDPTMGLTGRAWRILVPRVARAADRVITISKATQRQVVELMAVSDDKIDVTYLGFGAQTGTDATPEYELRKKLALGDGPVILSVSQLKLHKNLLRLIHAFARVRQQFPTAVLVIPGAPNNRHQPEIEHRIRALGLERAVVLPGFVEPSDLEGLYACASCLVLASTEEGFGLPLLEAMARDLPVACSNASAIPEVAGEAARYFDPLDADDIAASICELLGNPALCGDLVRVGRNRYREFSWRRCARDTLASFERAGLEL